MPAWAQWLLAAAFVSALTLGVVDRFIVGVRLARLEAEQFMFRRELVGRCSTNGFHRNDFDGWLGYAQEANPGLIWPSPPTPALPPVCFQSTRPK